MPQASTQLMARAIGPFTIVLALAIALQTPNIDLLTRAFLGDAPLVIVTGFFGLALGCAMLAVHSRWNGPSAIIVSLFGCAMLLRSAMLLIAPQVVDMVATGITGVPGLPLVLAIIGGVIGVWLSYVGWLSKAAP